VFNRAKARESAAEAAAPFIHGRGSVARMGVPVRRRSCCRSRWAAPGPEKRETWSSSNRTTNSRGRGLANGERTAWNPRSNAAEASSSRARREQPRSGEWRSATTPGKERLGSRVGDGTGTEGAVTRRWKTSRIVEASSPSRAVRVKRSSAPPKVGAQAMARAHEPGDGDRGVRGMVARFASG
jgi:hypothetical protein